jgi:hypothetical protein
MHYASFDALTGTPQALIDLIPDLKDLVVLSPLPGDTVSI